MTAENHTEKQEESNISYPNTFPQCPTCYLVLEREVVAKALPDEGYEAVDVRIECKLLHEADGTKGEIGGTLTSRNEQRRHKIRYLPVKKGVCPALNTAKVEEGNS